MTRGSELMLYLLLGIPVAVIGLFLLLMGPLGWFLAAFLGVAVIGAVAMLSDSDGDATDPERVNCPACGSRTDAGAACEYCGEPL
ncbi:MAG: zinc ribbon domain-containing protein [Haloplanus sp.]